MCEDAVGVVCPGCKLIQPADILYGDIDGCKHDLQYEQRPNFLLQPSASSPKGCYFIIPSYSGSRPFPVVSFLHRLPHSHCPSPTRIPQEFLFLLSLQLWKCVPFVPWPSLPSRISIQPSHHASTTPSFICARREEMARNFLASVMKGSRARLTGMLLRPETPNVHVVRINHPSTSKLTRWRQQVPVTCGWRFLPVRR